MFRRALMVWSLFFASTAVAQVTITACVPDYSTVASLVVVNARRQSPPGPVPTGTPAGMQMAVITPPPTRTPNAVCGTDPNTGYVEQTVAGLGGPGLALQFAAWACSVDEVCSDRSNVLLRAPVPLAAPTLR